MTARYRLLGAAPRPQEDPRRMARPFPVRPEPGRLSAHQALLEISAALWPEEYAPDPDDELPELVQAVAAIVRRAGYGGSPGTRCRLCGAPAHVEECER